MERPPILPDVAAWIDGWLRDRASGDDTGAVHLRQALNSGRIGSDEARALMEHSPRFVTMLIDGLAPVYGRLSHRQFIDYARRGLLTNAVVARAMQ